MSPIIHQINKTYNDIANGRSSVLVAEGSGPITRINTEEHTPLDILIKEKEEKLGKVIEFSSI